MGYMNYEFVCTAQEITRSMSIDVPQNRTFRWNCSIIEMSRGWLVLAVCALITVAWNVLLIKMIAWPVPGHQIRTSDELNEYNFHAVGGPFSNDSIWKNSKVNY